MSEKLEPCPFCDHDDPDLTGELSADCSSDWVTCLHCNTDGPTADTPEETTRLWNTRPREAALKAENERLREVLGEAREALDDALWLIKDVEKDTYMEVGEDRHDRIRNVRDAARTLLNEENNHDEG